VGDSEVDYDPGFKFYMTSKLPNPHYLPEICIKVTIINFTVTTKGLEDQLLGDLVRKERPELEETRDRLVINLSSDKKQLKDFEDKILKLLKESEGNILDDEVLINTLNNSKLTSSVIQERVLEAEQTEIEINEAREQYRVVPNRASVLYFVIADLGLVDPMYQFSLSYFSVLVNTCIDISRKSDDLDERLEILLSFITMFVYRNVCRGLFEQHKMIFSFLICTSILRASGAIPMAEWNFFLRGVTALSSDAGPKTKELGTRPKFFPEAKWALIRGMQRSCPTMGDLSKFIQIEANQFEDYFESSQPFDHEFPTTFPKISNFQRLVLVKTLHEDKLVAALSRFVAEDLGEIFTQSPPAAIGDIYPDTTKTSPIIFILSTGADPTVALQRFGLKMDREAGQRLHIISLGQGQGPIAESTVSKALPVGDWVCLQNCHLARSWMDSLEKIVEGIQSDAGVHDEFRLWLTSMPTQQFPVYVLQNGIKVTIEPPKGIRSNLLGSFADLGAEFVHSSPKPEEWRRLMFACAFFHAVIQERSKFGPMGWNKKYDFSSSDLECSIQTLKMFLDETGDIPWPALLYVTGQINYGGRVTDDLDRRCLMSILHCYYRPEVLDQDFSLSASGVYTTPPDASTLDEYIEFIHSLPQTDQPEVFGMHDNANITYQLHETNKILDIVLSIQPRMAASSSEDGHQSPDQIVANMASEIESKLPKPLNRSEAGLSTFSSSAGAFGVVLGQEIDRFNRLLSTIGSSLNELGRALQGLVVMSADLEVMYSKMLNNQVPSLWQNVAYLSMKPLASWVEDFHRKMAFMRMWLEQGAPTSFWLPGFFFPQGFLTGALQNHARKYKIPIDTLSFGFTMLDIEGSNVASVKQGPTDGIYIDGLYLDGAQWDRNRRHLQEAAPREMYSSLPIIHFHPEVDYTPPENEYQAPLYKAASRSGILSTTGQSTNYVLSLSIPLAEDGPSSKPDFWVLQGVAMLCSLSD